MDAILDQGVFDLYFSYARNRGTSAGKNLQGKKASVKENDVQLQQNSNFAKYRRCTTSR